ncbi:ABC transporter permease [Methylobacterium flocculans]|uniref:ABC transporter permease n=1 Tax=Methylobacterium flocculans TaxID=2984843 RepID=UPI0021F3089C|nr:ABC transporter permease [Methylobacterium sp. FF17]
MAAPPDEGLRPVHKLEIYAHVIRALVLRDMRTRFGGSHWGYAVLVLWPVAHIFVMVGVMAFRGQPSPMGDSPLLFVATGCVPALTFQYISREVMKAVTANKPLLYYPQVKIFDVMLARLIVEIVKGFTGLLIVIAILASLGVNPIPLEPSMAIGAYCAAILLGVGVGSVNIGIVSFFPGWQLGYIIVAITIYLSCGIFYLPHLLPDQLYNIMKWNPMVQIVEWTRLAYEPNLGVEVDYMYALLVGASALSIGLLMERTLVRRMT